MLWWERLLVFVWGAWVVYRLKQINDRARTNEARTDRLMKAITGHNFQGD